MDGEVVAVKLLPDQSGEGGHKSGTREEGHPATSEVAVILGDVEGNVEGVPRSGDWAGE